ncbi:unnamed protein product [Caenorhabditis bovis]|uniref:DUF19 domain-containing protein n=1 Tax=Caenorhabditis bovis TaxID=2654633 RepID=A0A8S1F2T7_9PELO|nr:unnamed protein product [Caenorhabditis bovis]
MSENKHATWAKTVEEEDRVEALIKKSGCWDNHISVVDCMGEHNDWRKCQAQLQEFKTCMTKNFGKNKPESNEIEYYRAIANFNVGEYQKCIDSCNKILETSKNNRVHKIMLIDSILQSYLKLPMTSENQKISLEFLTSLESLLIDFGDQLQFLRIKSEILARFSGDPHEFLHAVSLLCSLIDLPEHWLIFLQRIEIFKKSPNMAKLCILSKVLYSYEHQFHQANGFVKSKIKQKIGEIRSQIDKLEFDDETVPPFCTYLWMKKLTVFLSILCVCQASILIDFELPNDVIELMSFREKPSMAAFTPCQDILFNHCQHNFNQFFGMPEDVTWRNGSYIFNTVQKYLEMNVTELIKVCNARTQYYQCLGASYYSCINLFTLGNKPNSDLQQTFDFVRTFRGLEYMCAGGFQEVVYQWGCLGAFPTTQAYQGCIANFNNTVTAKNFCPSVSDTGDCLYNKYVEACGEPGAGYYGCENFRITFDSACRGLRCIVH